jgi:hypothetical protein
MKEYERMIAKRHKVTEPVKPNNRKETDGLAMPLVIFTMCATSPS